MRLRTIFLSLLAFIFPALTFAYATTDSYDYMFFYGEWVLSRYQFFGGCEGESNAACLDEREGNSFFNIGAPAVKQGMYTLEGPSFEDADSRFLFTYQYQFLTEESTESQDDYGIAKIKDVATNTVYYYKTFYPADATDEWVKQRVLLPNTITDQRLQLVFEVYNNDDDELSLMYVDNISSQHQSKAIVTGKVKQQNDLGKKVAVEGAMVYLKNKKGTKTLKTTTTDADGNFVFDPVKARQRYTIEVSAEDKSSSTKTARTVWGQTTYVPVIIID